MKLAVKGKTYILSKKYLEKVAGAAFSFFDNREGEIELLFVSKEKSRKLNSEYRDIDSATDVLSFKLSDNPLIGQIFICYNIAKEQAMNFNKTIQDEISLLLVHGILHIYDYDHISEVEANKMESIETKILNEVGVTR